MAGAQELYNAIKTSTPKLFSKLPPPATNGELEGFEKDMNVKLPQVVKDLYKLFNGFPAGEYFSFGVRILSLSEMQSLTKKAIIMSGQGSPLFIECA